MVESLIKACASLSQDILKSDLHLDAVISKASIENGWFTEDQVRHSLSVIAMDFLSEDRLREWFASYQFKPVEKPLTVGLVLAGNIPAVGFHDCLCVLFSPFNLQIKLSAKDSVLIPFLLEELSKRIPGGIKHRINYVDRLNDYSAVIATGSNHTVSTFGKYFKEVPSILRGHRNSIAVLDGTEDEEAIRRLGSDVYSYFGLGCRNVSKIVIPAKYDLIKLLRVWDVEFKDITNNHKYKNNYDYSFALTIMAQKPHVQGDTIILIESDSLTSRLSTLHYEFYSDHIDLKRIVDQHVGELQCVVSDKNDVINGAAVVPFGKGQRPGLSDYADGIDTMKFLSSI